MPSSCSTVLAYRITGSIRTAEVVQATAETILAICRVRYRGEDIGWHTAIYRSADMMSRNIDEVKEVIEVLTI